MMTITKSQWTEESLRTIRAIMRKMRWFAGEDEDSICVADLSEEDTKIFNFIFHD